jgi:hypothetical protein
MYLGISWTWCIGMFLPVLLIRDYGSGAFWVFAVPNVIGAAAMGWVVRSAQHSRDIVRQHAPAVRAFTLVTVAFHAFFVGWVCQLKGDALWPALTSLAMVAWMLPLIRRWSGGGAIGVSAFALVASVTLGALIIATVQRIDLASIVNRRADTPAIDLIGLALVCTLGFLTCPYLDATFHHARQRLSTPAAARWGFAIGFGVVFAPMIALTFVYADLINLNATMRGAVGSIIVAHMAIQSAATVSLHLATPQPRWATGFTLIVGVAALVLIGGGWAADFGQGELIYRSFMGFYGLVAPSYVLIFLVCPDVATRRRWAILVLTNLAAAPFYAFAFLGGRMPWATGGVAIVLLGALLVRRAGSDPAAPLRPPGDR